MGSRRTSGGWSQPKPVRARRDLQRRTIETIERRAQQVWVPVTVATLVPGVILLAVPFLAALRLFANA